MNILLENAPRYYMRILTYLADRPPVPEGVTDYNIMQHYTAHGFSELLDIPIAQAYRTINWLEAGGFITPFPQKLRITPRPTRAYRLTERGREYAAALRIFQQTVESL
jgi:DNA-binding PadR family transcriptional regulator